MSLHGHETTRPTRAPGLAHRPSRETAGDRGGGLTNGFTDPAYPTAADLSDAVAATSRLIDAGRAAEVPVVFTTISYTDAEIDGGGWPGCARRPGCGCWAPAPRGRGGRSATHHPCRPCDREEGRFGVLRHRAGRAADRVPVDHRADLRATTSGCVRASVGGRVQSGLTCWCQPTA